ncbi:MAG TPA: hypothetical protein VFH47_00670 [Candidatus Thermoplasmatota archaeon]|nr:hypothetical protein [Candidatus Thermoplasmatota archaeon]
MTQGPFDKLRRLFRRQSATGERDEQEEQYSGINPEAAGIPDAEADTRTSAPSRADLAHSRDMATPKPTQGLGWHLERGVVEPGDSESGASGAAGRPDHGYRSPGHGPNGRTDRMEFGGAPSANSGGSSVPAMHGHVPSASEHRGMPQGGGEGRVDDGALYGAVDDRERNGTSMDEVRRHDPNRRHE